MRYDFENKRFYKQRLKHLSAEPATDKVNKKKYKYKVLSVDECKEHGVEVSSELFKFAIAKFDGKQFIEAAAWFSNEQSANESLKNFPPKEIKKKKKRNKKKKKHQKKFVPEIKLVFGYNTAKG